MSLLRFGGQLVEFERLERFAEMFVLPLGASFALDVTAPAERAVARCRDQNPSGVVAAAAAQQVAAVDALGCFIARPAGCSDGTCFTPKIKKKTRYIVVIVWYPEHEWTNRLEGRRNSNRKNVPGRRGRASEAVSSSDSSGCRSGDPP